MGRISFIYRTDVHVIDEDKKPASWKGDYAGEIWSNLSQVGDMARQHGARAVLDGGDYFHAKSPLRNPHALVNKTARLHKGYPCPVFCVEGNHDITNNDLFSLERQPLGVLYATGVFGHLRDEVFEDKGLRVRVVGVPYSPARKLNELLDIQKKPGDTHLIAVVHALAGEAPPPSVEDFFGEPVFRYDQLVTANGPDVWMFGHWHKDQGIVTVKNRTFVNPGAISRGSLVRENLERTPKATLIEIDDNGVRATGLPLQVADARDVFNIEVKERQDREDVEIERFVQRLYAETTTDPSASIEEALASMEFAADIQKLAREYIELARAGVG
jgi:DNA repair exonuclease SbcCD nuclease subunit